MNLLLRPPGRRPWVYGHRGARGHAEVMENSLPAFELAMAQGADGVELDVRLCKSGEVVVLHDPDTARASAQAHGLLAAKATRAELWTVGVPTLDDAIDAVCARNGRVNVEAKPDVPDREALVDALVGLLRARRAEERAQLFVSSFSRRMCSALAERLPGVAVLLLIEKAPTRLPLREGLPLLAGVHARHTLVDGESLEGLRKGGGALNCWTVNDAAEARRLEALGVDGIITDDVPTVLSALGGRDSR